MKYDNQLRYAVRIVQEYDGRSPLSLWLKDFFRANKQMGSRDRKTVSSLVYGYFRLGHTPFSDPMERMLSALFAGGQLKEIIDHYRLLHPVPPFSADHIFPWNDLLSEGIDAEAFAISFLTQPDLFLRIRPGRKEKVLAALAVAGIPHSPCGDSCLSLPNAAPIGGALKLNEDAVVQDKSSQRTGELLRGLQVKRLWDCCAASGGKSIMAYDILQQPDITVSDIRESILHNLRRRFAEAGISRYQSFVADVSDPATALPADLFDLVIADVPCTGSGTWARTPEQLYYFRPEKIDYYTALQQRITGRASERIAGGGYLLYITCSVFRQENEEMVNYILSNNNRLTLVRQSLVAGYREKADTMFAALFRAATA